MSSTTDLILTTEEALNIHTALSFALKNAKALDEVLVGFDDEWEGYATRAVALIELAIALLDGGHFTEA